MKEKQGRKPRVPSEEARPWTACPQLVACRALVQGHTSRPGPGGRAGLRTLALELASLGRQAGRISQSFPLFLSQHPFLDATHLEIQFKGHHTSQEGRDSKLMIGSGENIFIRNYILTPCPRLDSS